MLTVVNKYKLTNSNAVRINIMRPSALGNPFIIGKDGNRDQVIDKYKAYLFEEVNKKGNVWKELARIYLLVKEGKDVELVCCCKPKKLSGKNFLM